MANNTDGLSDKTLVQNSDGIRSACSEWNGAVKSADLSSIDVSSVFAPLVENGIAVNYVSSLKTALSSVESMTTKLISIIGANVDTQEEIDTTTKNKVSGSKSGGYRNYGGGSSGEGASGDITPSDSEVKDTESDLEVKKEFDDYVSKLDQYKELDFISAFYSILGTDAYKLLYDEKYSSLLKEKILSSPNVDADLKKIISKMDQNEVQTYLRDLLVTNAQVSDFSQFIVNEFSEVIKEDFKAVNISNTYGSIAKSYTNLSESKTVQVDLNKLYLGDVSDEDDYTISFTRTVIDTLSSQTGISYEDLLSDSRYSGVLKDAVVDLAKTFTSLSIMDSIGGNVEK